MKTNVLLVLSVFVCFNLRAQSNVDSSGLQPPENAPETATSQSGVVPGAIPPAERVVTGNFTANDATAVDLALVLANLQPQLERAVALLAAVNRGELELPPASAALPALPVLAPDQPEPTSGQRLSDNRSANHSSRHSENLSTNISVPAGLLPARPTAPGPPVATSSGVVIPGPVSVVSKPVPPATYRSLGLLEQQIRQMLPLVVAVNRNDTFRSLAASAAPAQPPENEAAASAETPTPTGRATETPPPPQNIRLR